MPLPRIIDILSPLKSQTASIPRDLLLVHNDLHRFYGDDPGADEECLQAEKTLVKMMNSLGFPNRHTDTLSYRADTVAIDPVPITIAEMQLFLTPVGLERTAIAVIKCLDDNSLWLDVQSPILQDQVYKDAIVRAVNRCIPLKSIEEHPDYKSGRTQDESYAQIIPVYKLCLQPISDPMPDLTLKKVTTLKSIMNRNGQGSSADRAPKAFVEKAHRGTIHTKILKSSEIQPIAESSQGPTERIVTSVVLEPEVIDGTRSPEMGTEGDVYSAEEITECMYWWMENAKRSFSYKHIEMGGTPLVEDADVVLLESWQTRAEEGIGNYAVKQGTWVITVRVYNEKLWNAILNGEIQSFSIGADVLAAIEEVPVLDPDPDTLF